MCASLISLVRKLLSSATTRRSVCFRSPFSRVHCPIFCSTSSRNSYNDVDVRFAYSSSSIRSRFDALIGHMSTSG